MPEEKERECERKNEEKKKDKGHYVCKRVKYRSKDAWRFNLDVLGEGDWI
jgi:hypothetical protein